MKNLAERSLQWIKDHYYTNRDVFEEAELERIINDMHDLVVTYGLDTELGFEYEGQWITNPYYDETARFSVDPIEYYGEAYLQSSFVK